MPYFGQELLLQAEAKGPLTDKAYRKALAQNRRLRAGRRGSTPRLRKHRLDALVAPDRRAGVADRPASTATTSRAAARRRRRSPATRTSPCPPATSSACRSGISFFGRAWSEPTLIKLAYAFEQATHVRGAPRFLPTAPLT